MQSKKQLLTTLVNSNHTISLVSMLNEQLPYTYWLNTWRDIQDPVRDVVRWNVADNVYSHTIGSL